MIVCACVLCVLACVFVCVQESVYKYARMYADREFYFIVGCERMLEYD